MRLLSIAGLIGISLAATWPHLLLHAQAAPSAKWREIREHQPAALHLKLVLAKDLFFQGEKMDATLEFSNDDSNSPYSLMVGTGDPGAIFHATDEKGNAVIDPLQWRNDWYPMVIMGPVAMHPLGRYSLKLPANDTLRFDKPGVYTLYAHSHVTEGSSFTNRSGADLVSDETRITILPLTAEQEKATISGALRKIGESDSLDNSSVRDGIAELNCLQTPAARDELIALLARPELSRLARTGLLSAPDPSGEAQRILSAVQAGKLVLDVNGAELYGELKSSSLIRGSSPRDLPEQEAQKRFDELWNERDAAKQEILAAAIQAPRDHGPAYIEALWAAFQDAAIHKNPGEKDRDGGKARTAMAAHQLEFPAKHVQQLLDAWTHWGSADFLPLIRREAGPPANNFIALIALAGLQPDEARPRIIKELGLPDSRLFQGYYPASTLLCALPPMPLPQFNSLFRAKLAEAKGDAFPIIPVIGCFGSPALLPDVVESYQKYGRDPRCRWDDAILHSLFLYWLHSDPKAGAAALEQEIQSRGKEGGAFLLAVLRDPWIDDGLPVVQWALQSSNSDLVGEGVFLLEKHGSKSSIDSVIAALERFRSSTDDTKFSSYHARRLLKSERWQYTAGQKRRLEALASASKSQ